MARPPRDRTFTGVFALLACATACAVVAIAAPRPIEPSRLPALSLSADALSRQREQDRALLAQVPRGADVDALMRLYRAEGEAEHARETNADARAARRSQLTSAAREVFARLDHDQARALMLHTSERALAALRGELDARGARGLLGVFPRLLVRYGYADVHGNPVGPPLSLRAFYATRFNLICERPLTASFSPLERLAHLGFRALHAGGLEPEQRAQSAAELASLGASHGQEAEAIWRFQGGAPREALSLLRRAHAETGLMRLRNMALYVAHQTN